MIINRHGKRNIVKWYNGITKADYQTPRETEAKKKKTKSLVIISCTNLYDKHKTFQRINKQKYVSSKGENYIRTMFGAGIMYICFCLKQG